jgi:adenosylhomocysteine nucleosidase
MSRCQPSVRRRRLAAPPRGTRRDGLERTWAHTRAMHFRKNDPNGQAVAMPYDSGKRHVVILAPMPLEMDAIVTAFGLSPTSDAKGAPWTGRVGNWDVTAIHIGMGPPLTRAASSRLFDETVPGYVPVDHMMIAGICGGLDPDLEVGTLINPEVVVDYPSGATYRHTPPGDVRQAGKLITTEGVSLDLELSQRFFEEGCLGVDMESSAVAEVCEAHGCPWSVYRCIGDRPFDGLLDERIVALTNPDGSGKTAEIGRLIASEPELAATLERLSHDATLAARLAAEAAVRGCLALDA